MRLREAKVMSRGGRIGGIISWFGVCRVIVVGWLLVKYCALIHTPLVTARRIRLNNVTSGNQQPLIRLLALLNPFVLSLLSSLALLASMMFPHVARAALMGTGARKQRGRQVSAVDARIAK